jgi:hypothetical protein
MKIQNSGMNSMMNWTARLLLAGALLASFRAMAIGTWIPLATKPSVGIGQLHLLSDGSVMAQQSFLNGYSSNWFKLTPDTNGSYVHGTWTNLHSMQYTRLWYSSQVLKDGRVFVAGGEYGTGSANSEVYNPVTDTWTPVVVPVGLITGFFDSESAILPNGNVLVSPVAPVLDGNYGTTVVFNPESNAFYNSLYSLVFDHSTDEESWVKLADGSILTFDGINLSQRFIPSGTDGEWCFDQDVPIKLYDSISGEMGPGFLLPNGHAFFLGGEGNTLLYTPSPSGGTNYGSWTIGPAIPEDPFGNQEGGIDSAGAMMVNGKILCAVSQVPFYSGTNVIGYPTNTYFYEFDYTAPTNLAFTAVGSPGIATAGSSEKIQTYWTMMLALPDGNILYSDQSSQLYIYQPDPTIPPLNAGKPAISSITQNSDGTYHLVGTGLNGISSGAAYGDDAQMDSNYPLVRMTNSANGNVYYARTYNWSTSGVMTGSQPVTTEFALTTSILQNPGTYSLVVVANGNASAPVSFTVPSSTWVDFNYTGGGQNGSYNTPFATLAQGVSTVPSGLAILIKTAGSSPETMTITKPMTIRANNGAATIGN